MSNGVDHYLSLQRRFFIACASLVAILLGSDSTVADGICPAKCPRARDGAVNPACDVQSAADCSSLNPADPVESLLLSLGLNMDGDITSVANTCSLPTCGEDVGVLCTKTDFLGNPAVALIDQIDSQTPGFFAGADGTGEPIRPGAPSGFNAECLVLLFEPDRDPSDGVDTSFLYVAFDVADPTNFEPVPFDIDNDGSACCTAAPIKEDEFGTESYIAFLQGCADFSLFNPTERGEGPGGSTADGTVTGVRLRPDLQITTAVSGSAVTGFPLQIVVENPADGQADIAPNIISFPTADGFGTGCAPGTTTNCSEVMDCIDQELHFCRAPSDDNNNVEILVKGIETSPLFGREAADPDSEAAREMRFLLSQLVMVMDAGSNADTPEEERAAIGFYQQLPEVEVSKQVRCIDPVTGEGGEFAPTVDVLPGSVVEFEITVQNRGNEDLYVSLSDVMSDLGNCEVLCEDNLNLQARLTRPREGLMNVPINSQGAAITNELDPAFFGLNAGNVCPDFIEAIQAGAGASVPLGRLLGVEVERSGPGTCALTNGDTLSLRFRARVNEGSQYCDNRIPNDCENAVSATGVISPAGEPAPAPGTLADTGDQARVIDTDLEGAAGADDNVAAVNVLCRDITFEKTDNLPSLPNEGGVTLTYTFTVNNGGEFAEEATIVDPDLCADVLASGASFAAPGVATSCPICVNPVTGFSGTVNPGATLITQCAIAFANPASVAAFLAADDARGPGPNDPPDDDCEGGTNDPICHVNRATLTVEGLDLPDACNAEDTYRACEEICGGCEITVEKNICCVGPDGSEASCSPDVEATLAGKRLRFQIEACNAGADVQTVCITDNLSCRPWLINGTLTAELNGNPVNLAGFRFDNAEVCFALPETLGAGECLLIEFDVQIPATGNFAPATDCTNTVTVDGYQGEVTPGGPDCEDTDDARIDVIERDVDFDKDVEVRDATGGLLDPNGIPVDGTAPFPLTITYTYTATNNGGGAEHFRICDLDLCDDVAATAGVNLGVCDVCPACNNGTMAVGETVVRTCSVVVTTPAALSTFLGLDDSRTIVHGECNTDGGPDCTEDTRRNCYQNKATLRVDNASGITSECDEEEKCVECSTICSECALEVTKEVKCADDPDTAYAPTKTALAGERLTYRFQVENTSVPVEELCFTDTLSCQSWLEAGTLSAFIDEVGPGTRPVNLANFQFNGTRRCYVISPALGTGEVLNVTFDVTVPASVPVGVSPDCMNSIVVDGYVDSDTSNTAPPDCQDTSEAVIEVLVPNLVCDKLITVEDSNGTVFGPDDRIEINTDVNNLIPPFTVKWTLTARNPAGLSEMSLNGVTISDAAIEQRLASLAADPQPDITVVNCNLPVAVGTLGVGAVHNEDCEIRCDTVEAWVKFASNLVPGGEDECLDNEIVVVGTPDAANIDCGEGAVREVRCDAELCIRESEDCTLTKAKFDIWNMNEVKFSGTERCVLDWDQELISNYRAPNHMLVQYLQTNKGKARIQGMASTVCDRPEVFGPNGNIIQPELLSENAPLLGVAAKLLTFAQRSGAGALGGDPNGLLHSAASGFPLIGMGTEAGQITYTPQVGGPEERPSAPRITRPTRGQDERIVRTPVDEDGVVERALGEVINVAQVDVKGSLLVYPKVELKWRGEVPTPGMLVQDTFISLLNDFPDNVTIQMYFVADAEDRCDAWVDSVIELTGNHPVYWSAALGMPTNLPPGPLPPNSPPLVQVPPFSSIGDGFFTEPDPQNPGQVLTVLRGYILAWAVDSQTGEEIRWNHLSGSATIVNYAQDFAWEYNAWAFRALAGQENGDLLLSPLGELSLNGVEYDFAPDWLLLDFYATGARLSSDRDGFSWPAFTIDTDLTLWPAIKDLRSR